MNIVLREVDPGDIATFYDHQLDEAARKMAAFPERDRASFDDHWQSILADETILKRTVLVEGEIAGTIVSFVQGGKREVGYWLGRTFWGRGIATRVLTAFLKLESARPLYAAASEHNPGSQRVLEKCGFVRIGQEDWLDETGDVIRGLVFERKV
jgi:RimJ/RimL family protein N-acetyltransferase